MLTFRSTVLSFLFGVLTLSLNACTPTYPKCETDEHCSEKGEGGKDQVCVATFCRDCRDDNQCTQSGQVCSTSNKCEYKLGYCDPNRPCTGNQKCRNNECGAQCLDNNECSSSEFCDDGNCISKPECGPNADRAACDPGFKCDTGRCVKNFTACRPDQPIYFPFDSAKVRRSEQKKIAEVSTCLKGDNISPVTLSGHADDVGDESYNLALGDKRAETVKSILVRLGVSASLLDTISYGEAKPAVSGEGRQAKNRRTVFDIR